MILNNSNVPVLKDEAAIRKFEISKMLSTEFYLGIFIIVVLALLSVTTTGFFSLNNVMNILVSFSYVIIAAIGMNMIIITSNIDVSTGALISVVCIVLAAVGKLNANIFELLPIAIVTGAILSLIN